MARSYQNRIHTLDIFCSNWYHVSIDRVLFKMKRFCSKVPWQMNKINFFLKEKLIYVSIIRQRKIVRQNIATHRNDFADMVNRVTEEQNKEEKSSKDSGKEEMQPIDSWIKSQNFKTTEDIDVPERLLDQVIGQDQAVDIVRKAAEQKRHVMQHS